jgi:hypothetical protein
MAGDTLEELASVRLPDPSGGTTYAVPLRLFVASHEADDLGHGEGQTLDGQDTWDIRPQWRSVASGVWARDAQESNE